MIRHGHTKASRHWVIGLVLTTGITCSGGDGSPTEPGVLVSVVALPVAGAAYRGAGEHVFLDGAAALTCGNHGLFSSAVNPPQRIGETVVSEYTAAFVGELVLEPPVVSSSAMHSLDVQARMAERITLRGSSDGERIFDTELMTFELGGADMPDGVLVRESPDLPSSGRTTITAASGGFSRVESYFDVWLEISVDDGRSWHLAESAVRMTLEAS